MPALNQIIKFSALIALTIAISTFILFTIKDKIYSKAVQISKERSLLISMDKREDTFAELKKYYGIVKKDLPEIKSLFPTIDDVDGFIDRVENLAAEFGGTKTIKFDSSSEIFGQNLRKLNFTIVFSGKKEFFSRFTDELADLPYFTKINKIEIKNSSDSEASPDLMIIDASIFLKK